MTGPLNGVRIVMMGGLGPAPFCGMLLGDLGADVIRVDPVGGVDGALPIDYTVRRSQRSLAADVKDPRGRDLVHRLAADADAFVDVYRPGVAERLGIGPDALRERNPRLVYARMTGYGQDGPLAGHAGHDINYLALDRRPARHRHGRIAGAATESGRRLRRRRHAAGGRPAQRDPGGARVGCRGKSSTSRWSTASRPCWRRISGWFPQERGATAGQDNLLDGAAHFYGVYATADGRHVAVGAMEPKFYASCAISLGVSVPHDDDQPAAWAAHRAALAARFAEKTRDEWERLLGVAGMLCDTGTFAVRGAAAPAPRRA